jgi:hypothetical protein
MTACGDGGLSDHVMVVMPGAGDCVGTIVIACAPLVHVKTGFDGTKRGSVDAYSVYTGAAVVPSMVACNLKHLGGIEKFRYKQDTYAVPVFFTKV